MTAIELPFESNGKIRLARRYQDSQDLQHLFRTI